MASSTDAWVCHAAGAMRHCMGGATNLSFHSAVLVKEHVLKITCIRKEFIYCIKTLGTQECIKRHHLVDRQEGESPERPENSRDKSLWQAQWHLDE